MIGEMKYFIFDPVLLNVFIIDLDEDRLLDYQISICIDVELPFWGGCSGIYISCLKENLCDCY